MASSMEPLVILEREEPLAWLRLNRPHRLNAVSSELYDNLEQLLEQLREDRAVRVLILTGVGRAFCVGADLKAHESGELTATERRAYVERGQRVNRALQRFPKPIVAAVNGHAIGAGLELALSCDFIVAAENAKLRFPELGLGTFIGGGAVYTLAQRVGVAKAKELLMLGEFILGHKAEALGLVNRCVADSDVGDAAVTIGRTLASKAPASLARAKELLDAASYLDHDRALEREAEALLDCMGTRDWAEGVRAFNEKRDPKFTGE